MNILIVVNDAPYGIERTYNALRIAGALSRKEQMTLRIFLMGDAVVAARHGQKVPAGYYNAETMLASPAKRGAEVAVCGTCMDARGLQESELMPDARGSTLEELVEWIVWAEKVLNY